MRSSLVVSLALSLFAACATSGQIFTAIGSHDDQLTLELVGAGVDLEARDEHGATPLIFAAFSDNLEGARILLEHGAEPNARREGPGPTGSAMFWAQNRAMIDLLLSHGADLELRDSDGWTGLLWHAALGNTEVVRDLIAVGADVSVRDNHGNSATGAAAANLLNRPPHHVDALVELLKQAGSP
jgi:ankyrin repeat protein